MTLHKEKIYILLFSLFSFFTFTPLSAQNKLIFSFDSLVNLFSQNKCWNGDLLISVDDTTLYENWMGYRDNQAKEEIKHNSIYNLGSVSKPFTSVAILQLQEKGLLNIDDTVMKYIPEFPYEGICIKHLLSHTSGIKQNLEQIEQIDLNTTINNDSLIAILSRYKPELIAIAGTEWIYSNLGYEILAVITERVSKLSFPDYLDKYIFKPAGMSRTFIPASQNITKWLPPGITENDLMVPHEYKNIIACEVEHVDEVNFGSTRKDFMFGAENIYSCVSDLLKFDEALRADKILSEKLQELSYTPFLLANGDTAKDANAAIPSYFGLGWYISIKQDKGKIIWHKGRSFGSRSVFLRNPQKKQMVAITDNFDYAAVDLKGIAFLHTLNNEPYRNPVLMSIIQKLGCETNSSGVEAALINYERRKNTERQNYYISEEETIELCKILANDNKKNEAKKILNFSRNIFPKSASVYSEYAGLMLSEGLTDTAQIYYKKAVELSGDNAADREGFLNGVGYSFITSANYNFAEFVLKLNTDLFPNSGNVYDSYAYILEKNNKLPQAILMEEKAIAIAQKNNDSLLETFKENLKILKGKY